MIGRTLSHFNITAKLGEGGMGEVYRAQDTKLGREVAIKVLPEAVAADPERLARFEREAKVLASLNHPSIAAIYTLESAAPEGQLGAPARPVHFLVMELVDGEDLAARIARGPMDAEAAVPIALHIATALEAAHEKGIIHRDLKPANVMLTAEGTVKVLDFGLAKALEEEGAEAAAHGLTQSPTLTAQMTQAGVLLGTAGYMSPEQARGQDADKRSDIWAFGVVLMEMLTGQTVYKGDTISDTLASVLAREPEWEDLPAETPPHLRQLLDRCLEKDVKQRLRDIGEARIALESPPPAIPVPAIASESVGTAEPQPARKPWLAWGLAIVAVSTAAVLGFLLLNQEKPSPLPTTRLITALPEGQTLSLEHAASLAFSPDGRQIAYVTGSGERTRLFIRDLANLEAREITDAAGARQPFFSPDGKWIGYFTEQEMKKVAVAGGASFSLADVNISRGGSWAADDTIYFTPDVASEIYRISASGGEAEPVTQRGDNIRSHRWPSLLPDGRHLLYTVQRSGTAFDDATIESIDLATGDVTVVHDGGSYSRLLPTGHLVFVRDGTLFAAPFDAGSQRLTSPPSPVATGVMFDPAHGGSHLTVSPDGTALLVIGQSTVLDFQPVRITRSGEETPLTDEVHDYRSPRLSPQGDRLAVDFSIDGNARDIWIYEFARQAFSRITFHESMDRLPTWTPDGLRVAFFANREGGQGSIYIRNADGSGEDELLLQGTQETGAFYPSSFSGDGKYLAVGNYSEATSSYDIQVLDLESGEPAVYLATEFNERRPAFSPDGSWIAYQADESGRWEIYIRPFPDTGGRWQVSTGGGRYPTWSTAGDEVLFHSEKGIEIATVLNEGGALRIERPTVLVGNDPQPIGDHPFFPMFEVAPDGQSVVVLRDPGGQNRPPAQIHAIFNWFDELHQLAPIGE